MTLLLQVLKVFPVYEDDADSFPVGRIIQHLQPLVHKLLQQGFADLQCLRLNTDTVACPELLGKLHMRHLELAIGQCSVAKLKDITAALGRCTTLEYLLILAEGRAAEVRLPALCLYKASNLEHVHLKACFPEGKLCLPPGCQLKLDQMWTSSC